MLGNSRAKFWAVLGVLALIIGAGYFSIPRDSKTREDAAIGLITSLPIYWGDEGNVEDILAANTTPHWVRTVIEERGEIVPIDNVEVLNSPPANTQRLSWLFVAQPRTLRPAELVALDHWIRSGGRAIIFADPFLTEESELALGDKRRPAQSAFLDPLLAHWGLQLTFNRQQTVLPRYANGVLRDGVPLPINLSGQLWYRKDQAKGASGAQAQCQIIGQHLRADCVVGKGKAIIIADAFVLQQDAGDQAEHRRAVAALIDAISQ